MMEPKIRSLITICEYNDKIIVSAEIPELDAFSKPCYYLGKGKMKGSYVTFLNISYVNQRVKDK